MAFNNGFPVSYQPIGFQYPPYQSPVPTVQQQPIAGTQPMPNPTAQAMTPPTIHAEIVQVDGEADVERWPVNAGASQMFMTKAEDRIIIKTMGPNGPLPLDVYDKRPPAPPRPAVDLGNYVTREELETRLGAILEGLRAKPDTAANPADRKEMDT